MNPLNILDCPLSGATLIEASAGTGKTWSLVALYLRLLAEPSPSRSVPSVDKILVVTYTRAATAELRIRLRQGLDALLQALFGSQTGDPILVAITERLDTQQRSQAIARVLAALRDFDTAAIYTIHGFCQRVLEDSAFESGQSFMVKAQEDDRAWLLEVVDDFWRQSVVGDPWLAKILVIQKETPDKWLQEIRPYLSRPYLTMPVLEAIELVGVVERLELAWQRLYKNRLAVEEGLSYFVSSQSLHAQHYSENVRKELVSTLLPLIDSPESPALASRTREVLSKLTPPRLTAALKKNMAPLQHPLFEWLAEWLMCWEAYALSGNRQLAALKLKLIDWVNVERRRRYAELRVRCFDDLLIDLMSALHTQETSQRLVKRITGAFHVVLIDEFQDTDPIQYEIFRKVFLESNSPVFFIGDPKQAIYSFRGADVFTYLKARKKVHHCYQLEVNYRSVPPLINVINRLFSRPDAFLLTDIVYQPVKAAECLEPQLEINDDRAALCIQWMDFEHTKKGASKEAATDYAAQLTAAEVAKLLLLAESGQAYLVGSGEKTPLQGGDIAILVNTHRQGVVIREALSQLGIASSALSQQSVFASQEASEILALLRAWAEPTNENQLKILLSTELVGVDASCLYSLAGNEKAWLKYVQHTLEDHQLWVEHGFMVAWRGFILREKVVERLLPLPDGKRRLANFFHLAELIQHHNSQCRGTIPLLNWLENQVAVPPIGEETMIRLDGDASLVKIVTIHAAKGLQYPIVFCPFLWDGALEHQTPAYWLYHAQGTTHVIPDIIADDSIRRCARVEALAEKIRLLYVAMTRAQYRLYLTWGWVQKMETAALSWLFYGEGVQDYSEIFRLHFTPSQVQAGLKAMLEEAPNERCFIDEPPVMNQSVVFSACTTPHYTARPKLNEPKLPWRVFSYSSLVRHSQTTKELERWDEVEEGWVTSEVREPNRFNFPRGAQVGTCLHTILETLDFTKLETLNETVRIGLQRYGIAPEWEHIVCDMIVKTTHAPLDPGVALAEVGAMHRLTELDFVFPVECVDSAQLIRLLSQPNNGLHPLIRKAALTLNLPTIIGYLKGFIDLVCEARGKVYLIDYKSNYLGDQPQDYCETALVKSIASEHYYLQYLIYCVALKRYFASRGADLAACFGGVRYLYLRGLNDEGNGIWRDQPNWALIEQLDRVLHGVPKS